MNWDRRLSIASVIFGIVGVIVAVIFYFISEKKREPVWEVISPPSLVFDKSKSISKIKVMVDDTLFVAQNIYTTTIKVWNKGKLPINKEDKRSDFYIIFDDIPIIEGIPVIPDGTTGGGPTSGSGSSDFRGTNKNPSNNQKYATWIDENLKPIEYRKILDLEYDEIGTKTGHFRFTQSSDWITFDWLHFDPKQGFIIQIMYAGTPSTVLTVKGIALDSEMKFMKKADSKLIALLGSNNSDMSVLSIIGLYFTIFLLAVPIMWMYFKLSQMRKKTSLRKSTLQNRWKPKI